MIAAGALWAQRSLRASVCERRFAKRFPAGPDGIVLGAESRTYAADSGRALLLFHGYNDSPQSLDRVARELNAAGWTVRVPLLPGHGRSLRAFDDWSEEEVLALAREEYAALRARHRTVVVGGLSMGGAIACSLAAESDAAGVVLYAPMLFVPRPMEVVVYTARLWNVFTRYVSGGGKRSIRDREAAAEMIAYGCSSRRSVEVLERLCRHTVGRLGFVHAPVIVMQSEEDNRLPFDQSRRAIARIGTDDKTVLFTRGAGHVVTVDHGWRELLAQTVHWLDARFPRSVGEVRTAG